MSRQAHIDSVNLAITQLDKFRAALDRASMEADALMDVLDTAIGDTHNDGSPGAAARSYCVSARNGVDELQKALIHGRMSLADYLWKL